MLQAIRDRAQGVIAWGIVILISVPFALWGIQEYLGVGKEPQAATVNGQEITTGDLEQRTREFRDNLRRQLGSSYRPELFEEQALRKQVLEGMINNLVLSQTAADWGMRAGDAQVRAAIGAIPAFRAADGSFDLQNYRNALKNQGLSETAFESGVRHDLVMAQLRTAVVNSAFATKRELAETVRLRDQQRRIRYVEIPAAAFQNAVPVEDAALQDYYRTHPAEFKVPERVKVEYLVLDVGTIAAGVPMDEDLLRSYYAQHKGEFVTPEERHLRHILVKPKDGDDAAALARARELLQQLRAGADFATLARENSDDPGSASQGGDLGWVEPGVMVKPFEDAAYRLAKGALSEPVKTPFGYHIIQVLDVRHGGKADFETLHDQVAAAYRRQEAENLFYDQAERLADLVYENADSLQPAAEALDLKIRQTDWFGRATPPAVLNNPKAVAAVFSEEVLDQGNNSEPIELGPEKLLVLRVSDHEEAQVRPYAEVREQVRSAYVREQAAKLARQAGEQGLKELRQGSAPQALAEAHGWKYQDPEWVARSGGKLPAALLQKANGLTPAAPDQPVFDGVALDNGDFALVGVYQVRDGDIGSLSEAAHRTLARQLEATQGQGEFAELTAALRGRADISRPEAKP